MKNFFSSPKGAIPWMSLSDSEIKISAVCRKRQWLPFVAWTTSQFICFLKLFTFSGSPARSSLTSSVYCCKKCSHRRDFRPKDTKRLLARVTWVKNWVEKKKKNPIFWWILSLTSRRSHGWCPSLGLHLKLFLIPGELQDSQISMERGGEGEGHP